MDDCIQAVYETILERRDHPAENSYTRYLFDQGIDKILKKVGRSAPKPSSPPKTVFCWIPKTKSATFCII